MGELETEEQATRSDVADHLRELAEQLDEGAGVSITLGNRSVSFEPVEPITFKTEGESDWSEGDTDAKQSIEFELVWRKSASTAAEWGLTIDTISEEPSSGSGHGL